MDLHQLLIFSSFVPKYSHVYLSTPLVSKIKHNPHFKPGTEGVEEKRKVDQDCQEDQRLADTHAASGESRLTAQERRGGREGIVDGDGDHHVRGQTLSHPTVLSPSVHHHELRRDTDT